jgi:endonuclease/exonuclease/phosphatase (EEP) superfamily protein YafD
MVILGSRLMLFRSGSLMSGLGYLPDWILLGFWVVALGVLPPKKRKTQRSSRLGEFKFLVFHFILLLVGWGTADFGWQNLRVAKVKGDRLPDSGSFSVLSINLRYFSFGTQRLVEVFQKYQPDVIFLSETVPTFWDKQWMGMAMPQYRFLSTRTSETALLTRLPVESFREVELPTRQASLEFPNEVKEQMSHSHRAFGHAQLWVGKQLVHFIPIRFVAGRGPEGKVSKQLNWGRYLLKSHLEELEFFRKYLGELTGPMMLGGDLNATPGSFVVHGMTSTGIRDVWFDKHFWGGHSFSTFKIPFVRLDFLFASPSIYTSQLHHIPELISDHEVLWGSFVMGDSP